MKNLFILGVFTTFFLLSCNKEEAFETAPDIIVQESGFNENDIIVANLVDEEEFKNLKEIEENLEKRKDEDIEVGTFRFDDIDFENCNVCPQDLIVYQTELSICGGEEPDGTFKGPCRCLSIVAFVDRLADPRQCYSVSWDFGPHEVCSFSNNTLFPCVCFDTDSIHQATGQTGAKLRITVHVTICSDSCCKTFPVNLQVTTC